MARRWAAALGAAALSAALLGACADGGSRSRTSADSAALKSGESGGYSDALAAELNRGPATDTQRAKDRQVIYQGSVRVRVPNAERAADRALAVADDVGGYLGKQDSQLEGDREVKVTLRVPADEFDSVMVKVAKLGTVQARSVDSEDVSDQVVDLKGRLETAQASADRLRELLGKAENVQNIATLEDRLSQRESEIEQISGQLDVIGNDVDFATVRATFTEKDAPSVSHDLPGPLESLRAGAVALANVVIVVVAVLAFVLPFLPVLLLGWWLVRRWRRAHPKRVRPAPQPFPYPAMVPASYPAPPPPAATAEPGPDA